MNIKRKRKVIDFVKSLHYNKKIKLSKFLNENLDYKIDYPSVYIEEFIVERSGIDYSCNSEIIPTIITLDEITTMTDVRICKKYTLGINAHINGGFPKPVEEEVYELIEKYMLK
jgi:hypothetical protein